jgi:hypothetical protein
MGTVLATEFSWLLLDFMLLQLFVKQTAINLKAICGVGLIAFRFLQSFFNQTALDSTQTPEGMSGGWL